MAQADGYLNLELFPARERAEAGAVLNHIQARSQALALSAGKGRFKHRVRFYLADLNPSQESYPKIWH